MQEHPGPGGVAPCLKIGNGVEDRRWIGFHWTIQAVEVRSRNGERPGRRGGFVPVPDCDLGCGDPCDDERGEDLVGHREVGPRLVRGTGGAQGSVTQEASRGERAMRVSRFTMWLWMVC